MRQPRPPRLVPALLHHFSVDPALIGDLLEEYERRRSRLWLWRQVLAAIAVALAGRARDTRPRQWKPVNLTAAPLGSPVGGLGLLALAVLVSIVSPQVWWLLGIGVAGGIGLGAVLIIVGRHRELRRPARPRHNVLVPLLLLAACLSASAHQRQPPAAAVRLDPIAFGSTVSTAG